MQMPDSQRTFVGSTTKPLFCSDSAGTHTDMVVAIREPGNNFHNTLERLEQMM